MNSENKPSRFDLRDQVAVTGLSSVWQAFDRHLETEIALKRALPGPAGADEALEREVLALRRLDHPHIVSLLDDGRNDAGRFLCLSWVEGESLDHRLQRHPLTEAQTLALLRSMLSALTAVHLAGFAHADIKADNILIDEAGHGTLIDFGNATPLGLDAPDRIGSIHVMAPELFDGMPRTVASDLYAVGVLAYQCLSGRLPFEGELKPQVITAHLRHKRVPLPQLTAVSPALDEWIETLMQVDPAARPASAEVARQSLPLG